MHKLFCCCTSLVALLVLSKPLHSTMVDFAGQHARRGGKSSSSQRRVKSSSGIRRCQRTSDAAALARKKAVRAKAKKSAQLEADAQADALSARSSNSLSESRKRVVLYLLFNNTMVCFSSALLLYLPLPKAYRIC